MATVAFRWKRPPEAAYLHPGGQEHDCEFAGTRSQYIHDTILFHLLQGFTHTSNGEAPWASPVTRQPPGTAAPVSDRANPDRRI